MIRPAAERIKLLPFVLLALLLAGFGSAFAQDAALPTADAQSDSFWYGPGPGDVTLYYFYSPT